METKVTSDVVDSDLQLLVPAIDVLLPYLDEHWRHYVRETGFSGPAERRHVHRHAVASTGGGGDGAAPTQTFDDALAASGAALGILTSPYAVGGIRNPFAASALAAAANDWQIADWLDRDPRLRGSVVVPIQDPDLAAREIDRVGNHPAMVQIALPVRAEALYGSRRYYPIYEAALRHDLAIGIAAGGQPGNPPTAVGWPSHLVEEDAGMAHVFQSQLISLVTGGIFDRFAGLRVALIESGVSWLPALLWRLDKEWKGLRREVPWVRRPPSAYVRDHVRLTTGPLDLPSGPSALPDLLDQLDGDDLLMFGSAFPDHQNHHAAELRRLLPEAAARRILSETARTFYRLRREHPASPGSEARPAHDDQEGSGR